MSLRRAMNSPAGSIATQSNSLSIEVLRQSTWWMLNGLLIMMMRKCLVRRNWRQLKKRAKDQPNNNRGYIVKSDRVDGDQDAPVDKGNEYDDSINGVMAMGKRLMS